MLARTAIDTVRDVLKGVLRTPVRAGHPGDAADGNIWTTTAGTFTRRAGVVVQITDASALALALATKADVNAVPTLDAFRNLAVQAAMARGQAIGTTDGFIDPFSDSSFIDYAQSSGFYVDTATGTLVGGVGTPAMVLEERTTLPLMTGPNTTAIGASGYVASASSEYDTRYQAWMAFAGNYGGGQNLSWNSAATGNPCWLQLKIPTAIQFAGYMLAVAATQYLPSAWQLLGSNDGTAWTVLDTQTGQSLGTRTVFTIPSASRGAYTYHRLNITAGGSGSQIQIAGFELLQLAPLVEHQSSLPWFTGVNQSLTAVNTGASGHVAFASSFYSADRQAWIPFRFHDSGSGGSGQTWFNASPYTLPQWIGRQTPNPIKVGAYAITGYWDGTTHYFPLSWQLQGSNDGSTWVTLDTQVYTSGTAPLNQGRRGTWFIPPQNQGFYTYHRLYVTANYNNAGDSANAVYISQLDLRQVMNGVEATTSLPAMTSNSAPAGHAMTQTNGQVTANYDAFRTMDADPTTNSGFIGNSGSSAPWSFTRQTPTPVRALGYSMICRTDYMPYTWQLQASNDGATWFSIDVRAVKAKGNNNFWDIPGGASGVASSRKYFLIQTPGNYTYYRMWMTDTNNVPCVLDFQLLLGTSGIMDVRSKPYKRPAGVPSRASVQMWLRVNAGSIALNTNFKVSVARDGTAGSPTFKDFVLSPSGPVAGGLIQYTSPLMDITDLPSGDQLVARMRTTDGVLGVGADNWVVLGTS